MPCFNHSLNMKCRWLPISLAVALAVSGNLVMADGTNPPPVTVAPNPSTWGFWGDYPIDGNVDFTEVNGRVVVGYSWNSPEEFRGVYEFSLSSFALTAVSASLRLPVYAINSSDNSFMAIPFQLYGYIGDGQVTAADYSAGTLLSSFTLSALGTLNLDVSSFVASAFSNGDQFVGFNLRPNGNPSVNNAAYYFGTPTQGPASSYLAISGTIVPEPQSGLLLLSGMILLLWRFNLRNAPESGVAE